jgi:hypothetical protein
VKYTSTDSKGISSFTFTVATGVNKIDGKPFILHNSVGERVACGILSPLQESEDVAGQTGSKSGLSLGVIGLGLGGGAVLVCLIVLCCMCWFCYHGKAKKSKGVADDIQARVSSCHASQQSNGSSASPSQGSSSAAKPNNERVNASSFPGASVSTSQPDLNSRLHDTKNDLSRSMSFRSREDQKSWLSEEDEMEGAFEV